jgi:hypothetical protein
MRASPEDVFKATIRIEAEIRVIENRTQPV